MRAFTKIIGLMALGLFGFYAFQTVLMWVSPPRPCTQMTTSGYVNALLVFLVGMLLSLRMVREKRK